MNAWRWTGALAERLERNDRLDTLAHRVDRASAAIGDGSGYSALRGDWMGHAAHPLMTDVPIGCWMSAGVLDLIGGKQGRKAAQRLVAVGLVAVPLTALTGLADYRSVPDRGSRRVAAVHALGNTMVAGLYVMSWRRRRSGSHAAGVAFGIAGAALAGLTGFLGGHLSFARGTGMGPRGSAWAASAPSDLIGIDEVADLLTIPVDHVHDMVAVGLIAPVGGVDGLRFAMSEVLASKALTAPRLDG